MGYLNNDTITVDAILTKHGRRLLSQGLGLGITKAAFSDDGIDYTVWNPDHPSGSAHFGNAITNLPMLEAVPDDSAVMRYKLQNLDRGTVFLPFIQDIADIDIKSQKDMKKLTPLTENGTDSSYHYLFTDISAVSVTGGTAVDIGGSTYTYLAQAEIPQAQVIIGKELTIKAKPTSVARTVTVTITGAQTGAVTSVDITLKPNILLKPKG